MTDLSALWPVIEKARNQKFRLGKNDCLIFTDACVTAVRGYGFAADWIRLYEDRKSAVESYRNHPLSRPGGLLKALDHRLSRCDHAGPRGSVAARPDEAQRWRYCLGIVIGTKLAFVGVDGLVFTEPEPGDLFWTI